MVSEGSPKGPKSYLRRWYLDLVGSMAWLMDSSISCQICASELAFCINVATGGCGRWVK